METDLRHPQPAQDPPADLTARSHRSWRSWPQPIPDSGLTSRDSLAAAAFFGAELEAALPPIVQDQCIVHGIDDPDRFMVATVTST
jgi:hypothetical protein